MNDFEKAEFWEALGRLYNSTVAIKDATEALAQTAEQHERRLDRAEVLIEALLDDMKRHRQSAANAEQKSKEALETSLGVEKRLEDMMNEWRRRREGQN